MIMGTRERAASILPIDSRILPGGMRRRSSTSTFCRIQRRGGASYRKPSTHSCVDRTSTHSLPDFHGIASRPVSTFRTRRRRAEHAPVARIFFESKL